MANRPNYAWPKVAVAIYMATGEQNIRSAESGSGHIYGHSMILPIGKSGQWPYIWPLDEKTDRRKVAVTIYIWSLAS
jgi:hypothetical protein